MINDGLKKLLRYDIAIDDLEVILRQAGTLQRSISELLEFIKSDPNGRLIPKLKRVDIRELIDTATSTLRKNLNDKEIEVLLEYSTKQKKVLLDRNLFQYILEILVANAINVSAQNSQIKVLVEDFTEGTHSFLTVKIHDNGPNIVDKERIFQKHEISGLPIADLSKFHLDLYICKVVVSRTRKINCAKNA